MFFKTYIIIYIENNKNEKKMNGCHGNRSKHLCKMAFNIQIPGVTGFKINLSGLINQNDK
jgi:hypothetical protein